MHIFIIKTLLLPPALNILLALIGFICWRLKHTKLAFSFLLISVLTLWLLSTSYIARTVALPLTQQYPALKADAPIQAQAIVVLGSGVVSAPEYGGATVAGSALVRLRYAAHLAQQTQLPLLLTGGGFANHTQSEAALMHSVLRSEYGIEAQWLEEASLNTEQNASESAQLLAQQGISRVYLVTDALHMPRAMQSFQAAGIEAVAAPTGFLAKPQTGFWPWLPQANALHLSRDALHEYMGIAWARLR